MSNQKDDVDKLPGVKEMLEFSTALRNASQPPHFDRYVSSMWCIKKLCENFWRFLFPTYRAHPSQLLRYPSSVDDGDCGVRTHLLLLQEEVNKTHDNFHKVLSENYRIEGVNLMWYPEGESNPWIANKTRLTTDDTVAKEIFDNMLCDLKEQIGPGPRSHFAFITEEQSEGCDKVSFEIIEGWRNKTISYRFNLGEVDFTTRQ